MTDYEPPVEDMLFCLSELCSSPQALSLPMYQEFSEDLALAVLNGAGKFASEVLAPLNWVGDQYGVSLEGDHVKTPPGFSEAYQQLFNDGWLSLGFPEEEGGQSLPSVVDFSLLEMLQSSNMAFAMCPQLAPGAAKVIREYASAAIKTAYLPKIATGEWTTAMSLTEPQSGSDLSDLKTTAVLEDDHYRLRGQKIFISWADHDMAENIVHLVLAKMTDSFGGSSGISLFLVPKYIASEDGLLVERNDFKIISLEHKLGLNGSPTCTVVYGEDKGAVGYLIGRENQGLAAMFTMMNHARLGVGLQAAAVVERAYQHSFAYANERVQGRARGHDGLVVIAQHADVKRMLMLMKAGAEAIRALVYTTANDLDLERSEDHDARAAGASRVALLTPVIKGWATEYAQYLVQLAVQIHGGLGYIEETGVSQYVRDLRATTIYEGTSAIQAMDLLKRKVMKDRGLAFRALINEIKHLSVTSETSQDLGHQAVSEYLSAVSRMEEMLDILILRFEQGDLFLEEIAFDFMMMAGYVIGGWQMARATRLAQARLAQDVTKNAEFYQEKIITFSFYVKKILPNFESHARIILNC